MCTTHQRSWKMHNIVRPTWGWPVTTGDNASLPASLSPATAASYHRRRRRRILPLKGSRPLHDVPRAAKWAAAPRHRVRRRRRLCLRARDPFKRVLGGGGCLGGGGNLFGGAAAASWPTATAARALLRIIAAGVCVVLLKVHRVKLKHIVIKKRKWNVFLIY